MVRDRARLAFAGNHSGNFDIWTVNLLSGAFMRRTLSPADDTQPAWSPDGTELAFVSKRADTDDIWTLDLESKKFRQMTTELSADEAPTWAGNNTTIAFQSDRAGAVRDLRPGAERAGRAPADDRWRQFARLAQVSRATRSVRTAICLPCLRRARSGDAPCIRLREGGTMVVAVLLLLLIALLFGVGIMAEAAAWLVWLALILAVIWIIGWIVGGTAAEGGRRWYSW